MKLARAKRLLTDSVALVKRCGIKVTRERTWGVALNGAWHPDTDPDGIPSVCLCGALLVAVNPRVKRRPYDSDMEIIEGVQKALGCTAGQALALSEGFEGDAFGEQRHVVGDYEGKGKPGERAWYAMGKSLRRHADKVERRP